mgnify:CR=1 FL=1
MRYSSLLALAAMAALAQPPAPPPGIGVRVGATTDRARTVEFLSGPNTTISKNCANGACSVNISYTGSGVPDVVDFTGSASTAPMKAGTSLPGTCTVGQAFFKTDAAAGQNIYLCTAANTWTQVQGGGGSGAVWGQITGLLSDQTDLQNALNGKAATSHAHAGSDITSGLVAPARLGSGTPNSTTYLRGDGTWASIASAGNYGQSFSNQTSVVLAHGAGSTNVIVSCYDSSDTEIIPQAVTVTSADSVTVTFSSATSGRCVVNSSGGSGGGGGGTVYTGTGLTGDGSVGNPVRVDPTGGVASQAVYQATIDFPAIDAGSCSEQSITATGVVAGSTLAAGFPATLQTGLVGMAYAGSGVIVVRLCNVTAAAIDPAAATYTMRVIGGF